MKEKDRYLFKYIEKEKKERERDGGGGRQKRREKGRRTETKSDITVYPPLYTLLFLSDRQFIFRHKSESYVGQKSSRIIDQSCGRRQQPFVDTHK